MTKGLAIFVPWTGRGRHAYAFFSTHGATVSWVDGGGKEWYLHYADGNDAYAAARDVTTFGDVEYWNYPKASDADHC